MSRRFPHDNRHLRLPGSSLRGRNGWWGIVALLFAALAVPALPAQAEEFDCVINPSLTLKIGSPVTTTLSSVEVKRGDRVKRGQLLARLDSAVEAADLALADARANATSEIDRDRSKMELTAADLARGESLLQDKNIPPQKVDELRSNYQVARQDLITAELNKHLAELDFARAQALLLQRMIRSPVDGIVTQLLLGPGEYVHEDNPILVLAVISPLHVEAYPPARLWDTIRVGDKGKVTTAGPVAASVVATVTVVDQVFDAASGTFGVRLELPNPDGALPAGQRCRVAFGRKAAEGQ
jgi:RND family efflux transporter MFP subunit